MTLPLTVIVASVLSALVAAAPAGDTGDAIKLTLVPKGGSSKAGGYYMPQKSTFTSTAPDSLKKAPPNLKAPGYGTFEIGEGGVLFILDEPDTGEPRLFVDTNRNGDLTDDPATEWEGKKPKEGEQGFTMWNGFAMVELPRAKGAKEPVLVGIRLYRFDKTDPARAALKETVLFYRDYAYEGEVSIGGKTMKALLLDDLATGTFAPIAAKTPEGKDKVSGVKLLLDVNGNGKFDKRGESFDVLKPFNLGGTTYEFADLAADGSSFRIVKSTKSVAEIPTPPDLSSGKIIESFSAVDTDGKSLSFPSDYKGKVVLIDFWATWCGPCMKEMPHVVKLYETYHDKGLEILGISLDSKKSIDKMPEVMKNAKMTWRQVADGKHWEAELAQKFVIMSIPATILVDGTTGTILGSNLDGEALDKAIEKAVADMATRRGEKK